MTAPVVRLLSPDEWDTFRDIRLEALRTEPANFASDYGATKGRTEAQWRTTLSDLAIFGAFDGPVLVGITGLMQETAPKMVHRASIVMVYLRPAYRRRGIAAHLMRIACDHARNIGVWQLELTVSGANPKALRTYESAGFQVFGRLPAGYIHDGKEIEDVLMMQRI